MDKFCEQIVKKEYNNTQKLLKYLSVFGIILVGVYAFLFLGSYINPIYSMFLGLIIIIVGLRYISNMNVEYEYIVTNGVLDIDKIIAKKNRKSILSVDVRNLTFFKKSTEANSINPNEKVTKIIANDGIAENTYIVEFNSEKKGKVRLYFSPDEKTLNNLLPFIPRSLKK